MRLGGIRRSPYFSEQELMGQHATGMSRQCDQQAVLDPRERNQRTSDRHAPSPEVDPESPNAEDAGFRVGLAASPMPQRDSHSRQKLRHGEWLRHVVVRAGVKRTDLVGLLPTSRQYDDR